MNEPIVPNIPIEESGAPDKIALQESARFSNEKFEAEARKLSHKRLEVLRKNLHQGAVVLIWIAMLALFSILVSWAWHLVTPEHLHYLGQNQINELKNILFSAALAAIVSDYAKKVIQ